MVLSRLSSLFAFLHEREFVAKRQLKELHRDSQFADVPSALRELVQRNWLTGFQANRISQGREEELVIGPYRLLEPIGEGGMGKVFKARHAQMNRDVALKIIPRECLANPNAVSRFRREMRAVAQLSHPNIVTAFDANQEGKAHYLAMEFIEGIDLAKLVRQSGPLPIPQACEFVRQAALGLQHAQAGNASVVDIRADIYSLGCSLFYLLTGKPPFEGVDSMERTMARLVNDAPSARLSRPEIPTELEKAVGKMLARETTSRFQKPSEVVVALEPFATVSIPKAGILVPNSAPNTPSRKVPAFIVVALIGIVVVGILFGMFFTGDLFNKQAALPTALAKNTEAKGPISSPEESQPAPKAVIQKVPKASVVEHKEKVTLDPKLKANERPPKFQFPVPPPLKTLTPKVQEPPKNKTRSNTWTSKVIIVRDFVHRAYRLRRACVPISGTRNLVALAITGLQDKADEFRILDFESGETIRSIEVPGGARLINNLTNDLFLYCKVSKRLIVPVFKKGVFLIDPFAGTFIGDVPECKNGNLLGIGVSRDGKLAFDTFGPNNDRFHQQIVVMDLLTRKTISRIQTHATNIRSLSFDETGTAIVGVCLAQGWEIMSWDLAKPKISAPGIKVNGAGNEQARPFFVKGTKTICVFFPGGKTVLSNGTTGQQLVSFPGRKLAFYDANTGKELAAAHPIPSVKQFHSACSSDDGELISLLSDNGVSVYRLPKMTLLRRHPYLPGKEEYQKTAIFGPTADTLIIAYQADKPSENCLEILKLGQ